MTLMKCHVSGDITFILIIIKIRVLHGLKTEACTRDRLTRPDPIRAAQLNLEPKPDPKSPPPPPPPRPTTNN